MYYINPYIRLAVHSTIPKHYHIRRRIIFDYEIIYIEHGDLTLIYDDIKYDFHAGDIILITPGISHEFITKESTVIQPHIHFDMEFDYMSRDIYISFSDFCEIPKNERKKIRENIFTSCTPRLSVTNKEAFLELFFKIIDTKEKSSLKVKSDMLLLLNMIFERRKTTLSDTLPHRENVSMKIRSFLDKNYMQNISLAVLEKQFSYSRFYLEKCFKETYGIPPIAYLNKLKMQESVRLLKNHSVSETAHLLNFRSVYSFSRCFKNYFGLCPTKYIGKQE